MLHVGARKVGLDLYDMDFSSLDSILDACDHGIIVDAPDEDGAGEQTRCNHDCCVRGDALALAARSFSFGPRDGPWFREGDDLSDTEPYAAAPLAPLVDAGDGLAGQDVAEAPLAAPGSETVAYEREPVVGRFVIDKTTAREGLVIEVRERRGCVILFEDDTTMTVKKGLIDYAGGEPPDALIAEAAARGVPYVPLEASCPHCDEAFGSGRGRYSRVAGVTICHACHHRWKTGEPPIKSRRRPAMCLCCGGPFTRNCYYTGPHGPHTTCESCEKRRQHGKNGPAEPKEASYCRSCGCGSGDSDIWERPDGVVRCGLCARQVRAGRPPNPERVQRFGGPTPQKAEILAKAIDARNRRIAEYCASAGFALASEQPDGAAAAPAAAAADASESGDDASAGGAARPKWVRCDSCDKWRRLPPDVDVERLPERAARVQNLELPHVIPHAIDATSSFNPCPLDV